jgi:antitoxin MazE
MQNETNVSKWGHSLAIRIPQSVAKQARIHEGDSLAMSVRNDGSIVLRSVRPRYSLDELVAGITPKNRHRETDWGPAAGEEIW